MDVVPVERQPSNPPKVVSLGVSESERRRPEPLPFNGGLTEGQTREVFTALFASDEAQRFRSRWENIQIGFVDEPRQSVERADELVAEVINRLTEIFAGQRCELEPNLGTGDERSAAQNLS
jgi:hypothetical protein